MESHGSGTELFTGIAGHDPGFPVPHSGQVSVDSKTTPLPTVKCATIFYPNDSVIALYNDARLCG